MPTPGPMRWILLLCLLAVTGCQGGRQYPMEIDTTSLETTRTVMRSARNQVAATVDALNRLAADAGTSIDPAPTFERFSTELDRLELEASDVRKRVEDLEMRAEAFGREWDARLERIRDETERADVRSRLDAMKATYDELQATMASARDSFRPFMNDLVEIQSKLTGDLSASNIDAVLPVMERSAGNAREVLARIDAVIEQMAVLRDSVDVNAGD